jgi:hypothetical protein
VRPLLFLPGSPTPILVGRPPTGELRGSSGSQAYLEPLLIDRRGHCRLLRAEAK